MTKQDYISLFNSMHSGFFEGESVKSLSEGEVFEEMLLSLSKFDPSIYEKKLPENVTFGFYEGEISEIKKEIEKVSLDWVQFFGEAGRIFCGYIDGKVASFCLAEDMGEHEINGQRLKIGGPGCVGTVPEYRNNGIGLTMVKLVTEILGNEGYDYSYIHYTEVADWYAKLGYETILKWNKSGII